MRITNITINNFQSYYGEQSIDFGKGLNLIIGKGGKGKSKLFNAFYWVLFGKIYISEIGWRSTDGLPSNANFALKRHEYINKKALKDAREGDIVTTSVRIELIDDQGLSYEIERSASAERLQFDEWDHERAWKVNNNQLKVSHDSSTGTKVKVDDLAADVISELFPEGIRGYIWFQGESLDDLINFRSKENLRDAVRHISYYPYYEKLSQIISSAKTKIIALESKHLREANKHNSAVRELVGRIEQAQRTIKTESEKKKQFEDEITQINLHLTESENKLSGLAGFTQLVKEYGQCETEIAKINGRLNEIDSFQRRKLPELWILRGIDSLILESKKIITEHVEAEYTMPERKYLDNPGRSKLEEILRDKICFVCGSPVDEQHQHAIDYIKERMRMQEEYLQELEDYRQNMEFSKHFNMLIGKIADYPDSLLVSLSRIDKQYKDSEDEIEKLHAQRKRLLEKKRTLDAKIEEAKKKHGVDPIQQAGTANLLNNNIRGSRAELDRIKRRLEATNKIISDAKAELRSAEKELEKLKGKGGDSVNMVEETEWKNISTFLEDICARVQEKARIDLLHLIEQKANEFYRRFTEHDSGYKGRIDIDDDYTIKFDAGLNTSHEDRKKMSIINALLSLNQEALGTYYPFISDAPTSSFDPETTHKYLIGIKDIFEQTIIITKDVELDSDNYTDIFNASNVSRIYNLESKLYCEQSQDPEIYEVSTIITRKK